VVATDDYPVRRLCPRQHSRGLDRDRTVGVCVVDGAINWAEFWLVAARGLDRWRSLPLGNRSTVIRVAIAPDIVSYSMS
jgi:hypothetical protein